MTNLPVHLAVLLLFSARLSTLQTPTADVPLKSKHLADIQTPPVHVTLSSRCAHRDLLPHAGRQWHYDPSLSNPREDSHARRVRHQRTQQIPAAAHVSDGQIDHHDRARLLQRRRLQGAHELHLGVLGPRELYITHAARAIEQCT